ncbi:o-demethylpuromycin o-methyltransferase [Leptolyngbya sp. Heron Island J]|uniref:methyltransferase n=1 Tax=Leptolyngbya sp. Heron Island J TaxID=1385935 RepID=UPI0003B9D095|nr:methyltransferase [Leptolyngbya sp. Heron Island J]ESA38711.1 o-demethylpuromycin o-methyltransferase [Leptolyngbya sp. Heron Island J]
MQTQELIMSSSSQKLEESVATDMIHKITGAWVSQAIYVAAHLGISDLLIEGEKHVDELSKLTGAKASRLYRLLRALASVDIFTEVEPRKFSLNEHAEYLRSDSTHSLRSLSMAIGDEWSWQSWGKMFDIIQTDKLPLEDLYQAENAYAYFAENPESNKIFSNAMTDFTRNTIVPVVLETYDFSDVETLVDIGGSYGALITPILIENSQIQGILFDLPQVVNDAGTLMEEAGITNRCEIVSGDFFISVPTNGDAYILSQILHNFNDESCIRILKNIRRSMKEDGKLLVIQAVIPEGNEPCFNKLLDLELMIIDTGAKERTENEYREIFQSAGFHLTEILSPSGPVSILEGTCS